MEGAEFALLVKEATAASWFLSFAHIDPALDDPVVLFE